ncbi:MAG: HAD hydrolase-like protein, partial [Synergistaceae bacterium]|nr:HAD hydrolase-like protein [Synergistaceae bacterium]
MGASPSQSLLIGDYIYDMMGARRAGMRGVLVRA